MKKQKFNFTYSTEFCEYYDLTKQEAAKLLKDEMQKAKENNYALVLTGKWADGETIFSASTPDELSPNYTWIHMCDQELLGFDDGTPQEGKHYLMTLTNTAKL